MHTTESSIIQNPCLGALCLWSFTETYWTQKQRKAGPSIMVASCVLPIAFHEESVASLHARRFDGGLLNALAEDRALTVGLQERMEQMSEQTFESLQIAFSSQLLGLATDDFSIFPKRSTCPEFPKSSIHVGMMGTAARLGYWFATIPDGQICNYLRIRL